MSPCKGELGFTSPAQEPGALGHIPAITSSSGTGIFLNLSETHCVLKKIVPSSLIDP